MIEFVQEFHPKGQAVVELWIPTLMEGLSYQKVLSREFSGNATVVRVVGAETNPAPLIYARWEKVNEPVLKILNILEVADREGVATGTAEGDRYLRPTNHVQTDGLGQRKG